MNISSLLPILRQSLGTNDSFTEGARKIASFIRKTEEQFSSPEVLGAILNDSSNLRELEYILFSFLDLSRADFDMLAQAHSLRQLRRIVHRATAYPASSTPLEQNILAEIRQKCGISTVNDVIAASRKFSTLVRRLSECDDIAEDDRFFMVALLNAEARTLTQRSEWLSDHVDSYDMKAIARLLPLLTVCDEQSSVLRDIAGRLEKHGTLGRAVLTFEYTMHTDSFEKWKKKAGNDPSLRQFCAIIEMQRARLVPLKQLIAVTTLSRHLHSSDAKPLTWIHHALSCCTAEGFRMDIGSSVQSVKKLLNIYSITPSGSIINGSFSSGAYLQWLSHDMLTRKPVAEEETPSPRELVMRCINNDSLLLRLLENPKVSGIPGMVEKIVNNSRSLAILQKIATIRELHSGHANHGVPIALLKNPTHIPLSQLRQFINTRYIPLVEMKEMLHNPFGIRRDIFTEIKTYVDQRYR